MRLVNKREGGKAGTPMAQPRENRRANETAPDSANDEVAPAATATTLDCASRATARGTMEWCVFDTASCPATPSPQHTTLPVSARNEQSRGGCQRDFSNSSLTLLTEHPVLHQQDVFPRRQWRLRLPHERGHVEVMSTTSAHDSSCGPRTVHSNAVTPPRSNRCEAHTRVRHYRGGATVRLAG
jgi:hypothetical protein